MMQPTKSLVRYEQDSVTCRGATNKILQPQQALQARFYNLRRHYKKDPVT